MHGERVRLERDGEHIAVVTMVNDAGGCLDDASERELAAALDAIDADAALRAVVVTGRGQGVFVRHYDVRTLEARGRRLAARGLAFSTDRPVPESPYLQCLRRIETHRLPFVAAIDGVAMGGGFELALACDLRLAQAGDYPIGLPEVNIGLLPGAGGTQRLTRLVGPGVAMRSLLLGRTWAPARAAELGLVDEVVDGPVLPAALALARELAARHPRAVSHVKRLVRMAASQGLDAGLAAERTLFCDLLVDADSIALMARMNAGELPITGPGSEPA
jgi:enoyl-CoA hydratase/carnithine racemase